MEVEDLSLIEGATIAGELIELSKQTLLNRIYDSELTDCEIVLDPRGLPSSRFGARFLIKRNVLEQCLIRAKGRVHAFNIAESVRLKNCKFVGGPFTEPVFGSGTLADSKCVELIENCDFSECDLRDARFHTTAIEQLILPAWPHIVVVARDGDEFYAEPSKQRPSFTRLHDEVRAFEWIHSGLAKILEFMVVPVGEGTAGATVAVYHAEDIVRLGGGDMDVLRSELDRFGHPAIRY